ACAACRTDGYWGRTEALDCTGPRAERQLGPSVTRQRGMNSMTRSSGSALRHTGRAPGPDLATAGAQRGHRRRLRAVVGSVAAYLRGRPAGGSPRLEAGPRCRAPSEGELRLLAGPVRGPLPAPRRDRVDKGSALAHYRGLGEQLASERRGGAAPASPRTPQRADGGTLRRDGSGTWTTDLTAPAGEGWRRG